MSYCMLTTMNNYDLSVLVFDMVNMYECLVPVVSLPILEMFILPSFIGMLYLLNGNIDEL